MDAATLKATIGLDDSQYQAGIKRADLTLKAFADKQGAEGERAAKAFSKGFAKLDTAAFDRIGRAMTVGLTLPLAAVGGAAIKAATDLESLKMGLTAVAGSSGEAEKQMARLKEVAKMPGLGFKEAIQGSINLQAAGFSATAAEDSLKAFGNALATVGKGKAELDGVITALSQIQSKGVVSAEEINQLAERLPQIRVAMKAAFGTSNTEELQKMGLSSEEFVSKVTAEFAKLPKVTGGMKNDFENLNDEVQASLAQLGKDLLPITKQVVDMLSDMLKAFNDLPDPVKKMITGVGGVALIAGPVVAGLVAITRGVKDLYTWMLALKGVEVATGGGLGKKVTEVAGGTAARAGLGVVGGGIAAGVAGIAAGVGIAHFGGNAIDKLQGKDSVSFGDTLGEMGLNPFYKRDRQSQEDKDWYAARQAKIDEKKKNKQPPVGRQPKAFTADERASVQDAQFGAQMEQARSAIMAIPEEGRAQEELKRLQPLLTERLTQLTARASAVKALVDTDPKAAQEYWDIQRDIASTQEQSNSLKADAAKEQQDAAKKLSENARRLNESQKAGRIAYHDALMAFRRDQLANTEEEGRAHAEANALLPMIAAKQQELVAQAKELLPLLATSVEAQEEHRRLFMEYIQGQSDATKLAQAAVKEQEREAKRAAAAAKELVDAERDYRMSRADRMVKMAGEDKQSATALTTVVPLLLKEQADLNADMKKLGEGTKEYWQLKQQADGIGDKITDIGRDAAQERLNSVKKAAGEARKFRQEQEALMDATFNLEEEKLKNDPFLSDRERKQKMLPLLIEKFKQLGRPMQGESAKERAERELEQEKTRGEILKGQGFLGKGTRGRTSEGGELELFDRRRAGRAMDELDRLDREADRRPIAVPQGAGGRGGANATNVFNFGDIIPPSMGTLTPQNIKEIVRLIELRLNSMIGVTSPGTY